MTVVAFVVLILGLAGVPAAVQADGIPPAGAFSQPVPDLTDHQRATFHLGNSLFRKSWRPAPSAATASDGLGPLFNARACSDCHVRDGRGRPPGDGMDGTLILRLTPADPVYGRQIQDRAVDGHRPEAQVAVSYSEEIVRLKGGETVHLRKPRYTLTDLQFGPLAPETRLSPRIAPPVFGLGLLEAVEMQAGMNHSGRFGWKTGQATIADQVAAAFSIDIGIASQRRPALWGDCTAVQSDCRQGPHGGSARHGGLEVSDKVMRHLTLYMQTLAPPPQRDADRADVKRGHKLFKEIGCAGCHRENWKTGNRHPLPVLRNKAIRPFTDLQLHDMGAGLADVGGAPDGRKWRTAPLWGIGRTQAVSGHTYFLHDGRARNLREAILWHGGAAQASRDSFAGLEKADRENLLAFLNSL